MEINLLKDIFSKRLNLVSKFSSSKPTIPVLANTQITIKDSELEMVSTDLELSVKTKIPCQVILFTENKTVCVNSRTISELVNNLIDSSVRLNIGHTLNLESGGVKANFAIIDANDFPTIVDSANCFKICEFNGTDLRNILTKVSISMGSDPNRPILSGMLFENIENHLRFVAVDGYRLSLYDSNVSTNLSSPIVVPGKFISELDKILGDQSYDSSLVELFIDGEDKKTLLVKIGGTEISTRLLEGSFPAYTSILPKSEVVQFSILKNELLQNLKIVSVIARNLITNKVIFETIKETAEIKLSVTDPDRGLIETKCSLSEFSGDNLRIGFNVRFLSEFLGVIDGESCIIKSNGGMTPVQFVLKDNPNFLHIIMPIKAD